MICAFLFTQFPNTSLIEVSSYIRTSLGLEFLFPAVNIGVLPCRQSQKRQAFLPRFSACGALKRRDRSKESD